jgi:hypothetical protein
MRRSVAVLCLSLSALALASCGSTTSVAGFTGAKHEAAQAIANLQSNATSAEQKKICSDDLAAALVARLGGASHCETAIKNQLAEVDNLEASVKSVELAANGKTAIAQVKSIDEGKTVTSAVTLVKEDGKWKISGAG